MSLAPIQLVRSNHELVNEADYVLSIFPPRDSPSTEEHFLNAFRNAGRKQEAPQSYIDPSAMSPSSAREMAEIFDSTPTPLSSTVE